MKQPERVTKDGRTIYGFKMKLFPGFAKEYERRHNELWPEMKSMLRDYGVHNYSIFIDEDTNLLFGYMEVDDKEKFKKGADTEINKRWWAYMADVMETNWDNSPITKDLYCAFYLD